MVSLGVTKTVETLRLPSIKKQSSRGASDISVVRGVSLVSYTAPIHRFSCDLSVSVNFHWHSCHNWLGEPAVLLHTPISS